MAGAYFLSLSQFVIDKRAPEPCVPDWRPAGPCLGTCLNATMQMFQNNCPDLPLTSVSDCSSLVPCVCDIATFPVGEGVFTCGDCSRVPSGGKCFLGCINSNTVMKGSSELLCLDTGWASTVPPTCTLEIPTCPPIVSTGGLNLDMTSVCVGAYQNQVCKFNCLPQFYNPLGIYETTCTRVGNVLQWSNTPQCACQSHCNFVGECRSAPVFNQYTQPKN